MILGESFPSQYQRVEGVIHLDTNIGGGTFSPDEMVRKVNEAGLKVAIITDHDNMRVEYGIPFARKIIKKTVDRGGIKRYGSKRYIDTIVALRHKYPEILILHGAEAVPFYYWEGSPIKGNLTLKNWHKHILILGLKNPGDYDNIPSVGFGYPKRFGIDCIKNLWPVIIFILSFIFLRKKKEKIYKLGGFIVREKRKTYLIIGITFLVLGFLFLINNFPFCEPLYDQYHGDKEIGPYQFLIDYARKRGALTFWAHPEVEAMYREGKVNLYTPAYYKDLLETDGYTGFAIFEEGYKVLGKPGGLWDRILNEYCEGKRESPVWAIGELDYKEGDWMGETETVFFLKDFNEKEVLEALGKGRVYAVRGKDKPILEKFSLRSFQGEAIMGEELTSKEGVEVLINLKFPKSLKKEEKIFLIRNGKVIETFSTKNDSLINDFRDKFLIKYKDIYFRPGEKIYYRVVVGEGAIHELPLLVTNPIFVRFEG